MNTNDALIATLESEISKILLQFIFELNDDTTRWHIYSLLHHHLMDMKNKSTITDFVIVCDETNNPADVVIKPTNQPQFIYIPVEIMPLGGSHITDGTDDYDRAMKGI